MIYLLASWKLKGLWLRREDKHEGDEIVKCVVLYCLGQRTMWYCHNIWTWKGLLQTKTSGSKNLEWSTTKFNPSGDATTMDYDEWYETGVDSGVPRTSVDFDE